LPADRLKGFLMAPWFFTLTAYQEKLFQAVDQVKEAITDEAE